MIASISLGLTLWLNIEQLLQIGFFLPVFWADYSMFSDI